MILVVRDVVESSPHVSVVGRDDLCFNFLFGLAFCGLDGFAKVIAGLLIIIHIIGIKGRGSSVESHANISVNPRFLIRDCFGRYNVFYALPKHVTVSV